MSGHKIIELAELCLLPKLSKNVDERDDHAEFDIRNKNLDKYFQILLKEMENINLKESSVIPEYVIASLLILYYELLSDCSRYSEKCLKLSEKLNSYFQLLYETGLKNVLVNNKLFNRQTIFDKCIDSLQSKLTSDGFKRYPGQVEVYYYIIKNLKSYNVTVIASKTLPASLHLIDDYINENRIKGLQCCMSVLQCLNEQDFQEGNYYEVIYMTIKKVTFEKDIEVTKLVFNCWMTLYEVLPEDVKLEKLDDMYISVLDELYMESNLFRKAECMNFIRYIITIYEVNCAKRSVFQTIIADNLDLCCNEAVAEVLLFNTLQTLKEWIKYCWCIWQLPVGQKILSNLFKILYCCKEDNIAAEVQSIIVTLIRLCDDVDRYKIINNLEQFNCSKDKVFLNRLNTIKEDIAMYKKVLFITYKFKKCEYHKLFIVHKISHTFSMDGRLVLSYCKQF